MITELQKKCVREEEELRGPENNPNTLRHLAKSLSRACASLTLFSGGHVVRQRAAEALQRDRDHVPMAMMLDDAGEAERKHFLDNEMTATSTEDEDDDSDVAFPFELIRLSRLAIVGPRFARRPAEDDGDFSPRYSTAKPFMKPWHPACCPMKCRA